MVDDRRRDRQEALNSIRQRLDELEHALAQLTGIPDDVAELRGRIAAVDRHLDTLVALMDARFDRVDLSTERAAGIKTAITFVSVAIVPILVALIGGYFVLRAGLTVDGSP